MTCFMRQQPARVPVFLPEFLTFKSLGIIDSEPGEIEALLGHFSNIRPLPSVCQETWQKPCCIKSDHEFKFVPHKFFLADMASNFFALYLVLHTTLAQATFFFALMAYVFGNFIKFFNRS